MIIRTTTERFITNNDGYLERRVKGEEFSIRDSVGSRLINQGYAEYVGESKDDKTDIFSAENFDNLAALVNAANNGALERAENIAMAVKLEIASL